MRLRPNGKGGFLMTGIEAFETYQHQNAWTWEHQALLRARAVAGDADLCERFEAARRRVLCTAVHRDTLRADVAEMRNACAASCRESRAGQFDIKQDAGGIADIEFLVQYWVLENAGDHPELVTYSDNVRQLEGLAAAGLVESETARWLKETYIGYRTLLHHLSLEEQASGWWRLRNTRSGAPAFRRSGARPSVDRTQWIRQYEDGEDDGDDWRAHRRLRL